jgi:hypothetical protein
MNLLYGVVVGNLQRRFQTIADQMFDMGPRQKQFAYLGQLRVIKRKRKRIYKFQFWSSISALRLPELHARRPPWPPEYLFGLTLRVALLTALALPSCDNVQASLRAKECWNESRTINGSAPAAKTRKTRRLEPAPHLSSSG